MQRFHPKQKMMEEFSDLDLLTVVCSGSFKGCILLCFERQVDIPSTQQFFIVVEMFF